jgi:hypothetical protein
MRATDIVRQVLDLLDEIEGPQDVRPGVLPDETCGAEQGEPIAGRFKQIFAMLDAPKSDLYANTPNEVVADIEAVTTLAGGGLNGPKHPPDIRVKDPSMYPDQQEY